MAARHEERECSAARAPARTLVRSLVALTLARAARARRGRCVCGAASGASCPTDGPRAWRSRRRRGPWSRAGALASATRRSCTKARGDLPSTCRTRRSSVRSLAPTARAASASEKAAARHAREGRAHLPHEPERQIEMGEGGAGGHHASGLDQHLRLVELHARKARRGSRSRRPGSRCAPSRTCSTSSTPSPTTKADVLGAKLPG